MEICLVCETESEKLHKNYGVKSCKPCKQAFYRDAPDFAELTCESDAPPCDVTGNKRAACKRCRVQKCIDVGMKLPKTKRKIAVGTPVAAGNILMSVGIHTLSGPQSLNQASSSCSTPPADTSLSPDTGLIANAAAISKALNNFPTEDLTLTEITDLEETITQEGIEIELLKKKISEKESESSAQISRLQHEITVLKSEAVNRELIIKILKSEILDLKGKIRVFCRVRPVSAANVTESAIEYCEP